MHRLDLAGAGPIGQLGAAEVGAGPGSEDLDLVVEWCEPGPGVTILDVATGGGHVARRLREAGATVVTVDPAPGMQADTTATAENLPFADGSFDAVACRLAAHHFADVIAAVREMARVAKHRVVICDNTFVSEASEEADRVRDPSHVRNYSQSVTAFLTGFLSPYNGQWQLDYASFRPQEEEGRDLPTKKRNDLLHVDAFPTRPTGGAAGRSGYPSG